MRQKERQKNRLLEICQVLDDDVTWTGTGLLIPCKVISYNNYQFLYLPFQVLGSCSYGSLLQFIVCMSGALMHEIYDLSISHFRKCEGSTVLV